MHGTAARRLAAASAGLHFLTVGLLLLVHGRLALLEASVHGADATAGAPGRLGRRLHQVSCAACPHGDERRSDKVHSSGC